MPNVAGNFVPLITPFTDDGSTVSEIRLARLLRFYLGRGVVGFALATETGEFQTLSLAERKAFVELVARETHNAIGLAVNATTESTSFSLDLAQHASRHGARAAVICPPISGHLDQREHVDHIRMIASHAGLAVIVVDDRSVLQEGAVGEIAKLPNVHLAWHSPSSPKLASDWFRCNSLIVEPMNGVPESTVGDFVLRNRAAVAKCLLMDFDLECGSPRMPVQPVPYREIRRAA
jgi:hypothetical protein